jgi:membrane protein DedA with SNARE-associated domain
MLVNGQKLYKFISPAIFQFSLCFLLILFSLLYRVLNLPSPQELTVTIVYWFTKYGLWLVFVAAFIEGVFIIGLYFPGSLAIALSIYTLGKTTPDLFYIGSLAFIGFLFSNIVNYYLGKFGYYKLLLLIGSKNTIIRMQQIMSKYGNRTFFITGALPNFFAITSVCAGISNLEFRKTLFLQVIALLFWITTWTIIGALIINQVNLQDNNQSYYIIGLIFLWGVYLIYKEWRRTKRVKDSIQRFTI